MCNEVVLKASIHCEGCKNEVFKCLRSFHGVCEVEIDDDQTVTVRGKNLDPLTILERLRNKYSKHVELIYPLSSEDCGKDEESEIEAEPIKLKIVVLQVSMHCEGCANEIKNSLQKMAGVMTVDPNWEESKVIVKGNVDPKILVQYIKKGVGKKALVLSEETLTCESRACSCTCTCVECLVQEDINLIFPHLLHMHYSPRCVRLTQMFSDEDTNSCIVM